MVNEGRVRFLALLEFGPARKRGIGLALLLSVGGHVLGIPRVVRVVKPWAVLRRTWSKLLVRSIWLVDVRGSKISSDGAVMVSTMLWNSQVFAGGVGVAKPVEGLVGAGFVVGEVEAVELSVGLGSRL